MFCPLCLSRNTDLSANLAPILGRNVEDELLIWDSWKKRIVKFALTENELPRPRTMSK
jgi:hypothetical protein